PPVAGRSADRRDPGCADRHHGRTDVRERPESSMHVEIVEVEHKPMVAVRVSRQMAYFDLGPMFARWLPAVAERIGSAGGQIGGPALCRPTPAWPQGGAP